jgi:hypothetical protein
MIMPIHKRAGRSGLLAMAVLLALWGATASAHAEQVTINAQLIHASNSPGPSDGLGSIEGKLRGVFNFKSYKRYGGGSTSAALPSNASIGLGHGNQLALTLAPAGGKKVQAGIQWNGPSGQMLNTTVVMTRGVPVILGGGQQDGGTLIIAITAK